jgi:hypothetical protein
VGGFEASLDLNVQFVVLDSEALLEGGCLADGLGDQEVPGVEPLVGGSHLHGRVGQGAAPYLELDVDILADDVEQVGGGLAGGQRARVDGPLVQDVQPLPGHSCAYCPHPCP